MCGRWQFIHCVELCCDEPHYFLISPTEHLWDEHELAVEGRSIRLSTVRFDFLECKSSIESVSRGTLTQLHSTESLQHLCQQGVPAQRGSGTEGGSALRTAADSLMVPVGPRQAAHAVAVEPHGMVTGSLRSWAWSTLRGAWAVAAAQEWTERDWRSNVCNNLQNSSNKMDQRNQQSGCLKLHSNKCHDFCTFLVIIQVFE